MRLTLCGSTRFRKEFDLWNANLTLMGHVVYSLGMFGKEASDQGKPNENIEVTEDEKRHLDMVHFAKIDNSDGVVVLNVHGYVGESTKREVRWARMKGKQVFWLESPNSIRFGDGNIHQLNCRHDIV